MRQLQVLGYHDFPSTCMPVAFPQSLRNIELTPTDWSRDLPGGLKELHELTKLYFNSKCKSWDITRPVAELLPLDGLRLLTLGHELCMDKGEWIQTTFAGHPLDVTISLA